MPPIIGRLALVTVAAAAAISAYYTSQPAAGSEPQIEALAVNFAEPAAPAPAPTVRVQFFGDIMLDRNVARQMGSRGLDYIFEYVSGTPFLAGADLSLANLEGPFAVKRVPTGKTIAFRFDPALAGQLKRYGFDGFSLANNHTYDMGRKNVQFTRAILKKTGLGFFGDELIEGKEYSWFVTSTIPSFAFIGLHNTYHNPDIKKVAAALKAAREQANFVIVNVHWGEEYKNHSNKKQQALGQKLIDLGADAVIGHHPHVVQEMELYQGKPIFYSLGNFIFDQYFSTPTQQGLSVVLEFTTSSLKSFELKPFYGKKSQVFEMTSRQKEQFLGWFASSSRLGEQRLVGSTLAW